MSEETWYIRKTILLLSDKQESTTYDMKRGVITDKSLKHSAKFQKKTEGY